MKAKAILFGIALVLSLSSCSRVPWQPWEPYNPKSGVWGIVNLKKYKQVYGTRSTGHGNQKHKAVVKPRKPSHMQPFFQ